MSKTDRIASSWWLRLAVALNSLERRGVSVQFTRDETTNEPYAFAFGSCVKLKRENGRWIVVDES